MDEMDLESCDGKPDAGAWCCFCLGFSVLLLRFYRLQVANGAEYQERFFERITREQTMPGTRGSIYDRNGELLAYNELVYSVAIEDSGSYGTRAERNQALNETIRIQNGYQRQAYK